MSQNATSNPGNGAPLATFEFRRGELRGSHLSLFATRLVHRAGDFFEVMPLARLGTLRAGFERDARRMRRGWILLVVALLVLASYWPLKSLVAVAFRELNAESQGGGAFLPAALLGLEFCVRLLPAVSAAFALWALGWLVTAWIGNTVLSVSVGAQERAFAVRGRDTELVEFAESVAERMDAGR